MQCVRGEWRRGAKPARLSVTGSQAEEIQMGPPFLHSLPWAFFFDDALFIYYCYYLCCAALAKVIPTSRCSPSATASSGRQTSRQPNKPAADTLFTCFFFKAVFGCEIGPSKWGLCCHYSCRGKEKKPIYLQEVMCVFCINTKRT